MDSNIIIIIVCVCLLLGFLLKEFFDTKKRNDKLIDKAKASFGSFSDKKYSLDEFENIKKLFYRYKSEDAIDDITASDLDLDDVYKKFNICLSSPGKEYFYYLMRSPEFSKEALDNLESKIAFFENNESERNRFRGKFLAIGNMRKVNFFECLDYFETVENKSLFLEYLCFGLILVSIGILFFNPSLGVIILVCSMIYNIVSYYKERGTIEAYIICFKYIVNFVRQSKDICQDKPKDLSQELDRIEELTKGLKSFLNGSGMLSSNSSTGAGNPFEIFLDYAKMAFHIDIIKFYKMLRVVKDKKDDFEEIYILLGKLETYINIASVRKTLPCFCLPKKGEGISAKNVYHPLIKEPVKNSITSYKGVLVTGSNASGKSTFLKTVALNSLFAHTIHTCFSDEFIIDDYRIFSSMSLRDDLNNNDSYFMVEIKSLKRIFDYHDNNPEKKIMCFVDELLRGTNTVERIAACCQVLKNLRDGGILSFAATHDIELTSLLQKDYDNYHFDEEIRDNDVIFNYLLKEGKATTRNAIKLLSILGFSEDIVSKAKAMADDFTENGVWR